MPTKLPGRVTIEDDVEFGTGGERPLTCDVFTPPDEGRDRPSVLIVHGGGWQSGDKQQLRGYGIQIARYGFVTVCAEYRLSGEAVWPAQIHDVKAAVRWMRVSAERLGIDPDKIAVAGNSAGAHLALMVGATPNVSVFEGKGGNEEVSSSCAAVIAIYAPTQLRVGEIGSAVGNLLGGAVSRDTEDGASPITYAHGKFPPTMLVHGNADEVVPVSASFSMYEALRKVGAAVELHVYDGAPHGFDALPEFGRQLTELMVLFLDRKVVEPRDVVLPAP